MRKKRFTPSLPPLPVRSRAFLAATIMERLRDRQALRGLSIVSHDTLGWAAIPIGAAGVTSGELVAKVEQVVIELRQSYRLPKERILR